ncbi:MAG TPA: hypothetical protein VK629_18140 [Steroidobacteraceae bacterium]|nr:hypothetical protein [Steroidobacteraceae bacterium]
MSYVGLHDKRQYVIVTVPGASTNIEYPAEGANVKKVAARSGYVIAYSLEP